MARLEGKNVVRSTTSDERSIGPQPLQVLSLGELFVIGIEGVAARDQAVSRPRCCSRKMFGTNSLGETVARRGCPPEVPGKTTPPVRSRHNLSSSPGPLLERPEAETVEGRNNRFLCAPAGGSADGSFEPCEFVWPRLPTGPLEANIRLREDSRPGVRCGGSSTDYRRRC